MHAQPAPQNISDSLAAEIDQCVAEILEQSQAPSARSRSFAGQGVVQKIASWATVANLQDDRIRQQPDGQIFNTITHGKNTMGAYGPNIAVEDRWAIVAYVRALQKSQRAQLADLPPEKNRKNFSQPPPSK
jgi:hypothetical protein